MSDSLDAARRKSANEQRLREDEGNAAVEAHRAETAAALQRIKARLERERGSGWPTAQHITVVHFKDWKHMFSARKSPGGVLGAKKAKSKTEMAGWAIVIASSEGSFDTTNRTYAVLRTDGTLLRGVFDDVSLPSPSAAVLAHSDRQWSAKRPPPWIVRLDDETPSHIRMIDSHFTNRCVPGGPPLYG